MCYIHVDMKTKIEFIPQGTVTAPQGFRAGAARVAALGLHDDVLRPGGRQLAGEIRRLVDGDAARHAEDDPLAVE